MNYPTYLIHFNKNHDPKTGKFTFNFNHIETQKDGATTLSSYKSEKDVFRTKKGVSLVDTRDSSLMSDYNRIGKSAIELYKKTNDISKAMSFIKEQMGDEPYRSVITDIDLGNGQKYVLYQLDIIGNQNVYTTYGDSVATYLKDYTNREDYLKKFEV